MLPEPLKGDMKKFLPILVLGLAVAVWLAYLAFSDRGRQAGLAVLAVGEMSKFAVFEKPLDLPTTRFFDREGNSLNFSDFEGATILVNLWATWCEPCREEMPTLLALQKSMVGENFKVIIISIDWQGYKVIDPFLEDYNVTGLSTYWDKSNRLPNQLAVVGLPLTILISRDGKWLGRMDGPADWSSTDAIALMQKASEF